MSDPAEMGRKLEKKIDSTAPVIYADWKTEVGLSIARRAPFLVEKGSERFVEAS